jgi:hypothetical protein
LAILDPIDIPESALQSKPWFDEKPGSAIIREIKAFIAETGKPYLWRGHTHTKPKEGAIVKYVDEFDLPAKCRYKHHWAPCPCCSPIYPKYRDGGKIAWFPEECVIRLIGPECFRAINAEGHDTALVELRAEQQREKDTRYLVANLPIVQNLVEAVNKALPIVTAVDEFRQTLLNRLETTLKIDLWREVRDGTLRVTVTRVETRQRADGTIYEHKVSDFSTYAIIDGSSILTPNARRFAPRLNTVAEHLEGLLAYRDADASDLERRKAAKLLSDCVRKLKDVFQEMTEARKFASVITTATIRRWSEQPGSPIRIYTERLDSSFYVGRRREEKLRIGLLPSFDLPLPDIPQLSETDL